MPELTLADHVHFCRIDDGVIFLDLRQDKYFGLHGDERRALQGIIEGMELGSPAVADGPSADIPSVLADLQGRGILRFNDRARARSAPDVLPAYEAFELDDLEQGLKVAPHHWLRFLLACGMAAGMLRFLSIETIVRRTSRRGQQLRLRGRTDRAQMYQLVGVFSALRPFVFKARDECLYDSLAMVLFLARYGFETRWIFGVRTGPFGAHCWVQHERCALNTSIELTREFTPILAV